MFVKITFRRAYGAWFHITNLVVYAIFLGLLTVLVTTCTFSLTHEDGTSLASARTSGKQQSDNGTGVPARPKGQLILSTCEVRLACFIHT